MKIAIIGGTGMLAQPVAKALLEKKGEQNEQIEVYALGRNQDKFQQINSRHHFIPVDIFDANALKTALKGMDIIHINLSGHSPESYYQNHVLGTQAVVAALDKSTQKISMVSHASAYPENTWRKEVQYKLQAEYELRDSGVPYLIFMPSWIMETMDLFVQKQRLSLIISKQQSDIHWISAADFAEQVAHSLLSELQNQRIKIFGKQSLSMKAAVTAYANHHNVKLQPTPVWLAKLIGKLTKEHKLIDAAELVDYYNQVGEKLPGQKVIRTNTNVTQWLASRST